MDSISEKVLHFDIRKRRNAAYSILQATARNYWRSL